MMALTSKLSGEAAEIKPLSLQSDDKLGSTEKRDQASIEKHKEAASNAVDARHGIRS